MQPLSIDEIKKLLGDQVLFIAQLQKALAISEARVKELEANAVDHSAVK